MKKNTAIKAGGLFLISLMKSGFALPSGFVYLDEVAPNVIIEMRYASDYNFIGRRIKGYRRARCIVTKQVAIQLAKVQKILMKKKLGLKVYDCYRPIRAVNDFYVWSKNTSKQMKTFFFPREAKSMLFKKGYIAKYSSHSRGSTVDLTIVDKEKPKAGIANCIATNRVRDNSIDMGTNYDCLDRLSHYRTKGISKLAKKNRHLLRQVMTKYGFRPYAKEWWHFTYRKEPYKRHYFNFPVS